MLSVIVTGIPTYNFNNGYKLIIIFDTTISTTCVNQNLEYTLDTFCMHSYSIDKYVVYKVGQSRGLLLVRNLESNPSLKHNFKK